MGISTNRIKPMPDTKYENFEYLLSQLPDNLQELNSLFLSVSWENIDFDLIDFKDDFKIEHQKFINLVLENIPEWQRLVNCEQHPTHDYNLGIHTILVIKKIQESAKYKELNQYGKLVLMYTALLHDIEKLGKEVDPEHPLKGSEKACSILYRLGFWEDFINDVYILIKNHQILGLLAANRINLTMPDLVQILKKSLLVELLATLSIADIKSVKKNEAFYNENLGRNIEIIRDNLINYFNGGKNV
ncbi:MAG: hypothetical protein V2B14_01135 [bacterium]